MDTLRNRAAEALTRLEPRPLPRADAPPQLLACQGGQGLIRGASGIQVIALPAEESPSRFDLSPILDHTLLRATATADEIDRLCEEAARHGFASVCVNPAWVARAAQPLLGTGVRVCTVVGFPLGATTPRQKAFEAASALEAGALEVDMVLPLGRVQAEDWAAVAEELALMRKTVPLGQAVLKVILETCLLNEAQKIQACLIARDTGLDFVKTSTGFSQGGATEADVALLRRTVGEACGVKASGGIRGYEEALRMVRAGATRLGLSASIAVAEGARGATSGY